MRELVVAHALDVALAHITRVSLWEEGVRRIEIDCNRQQQIAGAPANRMQGME